MVQSKALQNEFIDGFKELLPIAIWLGKYCSKLTIDKNHSIYTVISPYSAGETVVVLLFRIVETFPWLIHLHNFKTLLLLNQLSIWSGWLSIRYWNFKQKTASNKILYYLTPNLTSDSFMANFLLQSHPVLAWERNWISPG